MIIALVGIGSVLIGVVAGYILRSIMMVCKVAEESEDLK